MDKSKIDYSLYLCTDRSLMTAPTLEQAVNDAIKGGCSVVQLREKHATSREFYQLALSLKRITGYYGIPLIINDRLDIAAAVNAEGVHLGQKDLPADIARAVLGEEKIIGVSANNLQAAINAELDGADYIGVGAVFQTSTKTDTKPVTIDKLKEIRSAVKIPMVAIGGIKRSNISQLNGTGINGVAVVSAVIGSKNITAAAKELKALFNPFG
ncbi:thiamine phosphate synthase [Oscillospiraceae bacterium LCP25S3_E10]|nr:thiamine phosphate synthase [Ruminococcus sp.]MDD6447755.1 thiamine phosphate synthase [Ruminococcus sp.]MDY2856341.1 thiamine phosphate synthase [Oscillospiraceae bacterium]